MHPCSVTSVLRRALITLFALTGFVRLDAIPAFPGAEGFGSQASGGRGGVVYHVTNLNDSGAGSFRDAVGTSGRIVVFDVGGIIRVTSPLVVKSNITIAGQSAPGDGVTIYGDRISFSDANNSICRYMRFREGINGDSGTDAVGIASGDKMIFDHVSASWGRDETFSISGTPSNITLQDCIIGQGLLIHSAGGLVQTSGGVSIFRSLYTDNWMRNPKIKGVNDYQNNVVYNWGSGGGYIPAGDSAGLSYANMINNYFIAGPSTPAGASPFKTGNLNYNLFHAGNLEDLDVDGLLDGTPVTDASFPTLNIVPASFAYAAPAKLLTADQAFAHIVAYAGASFRRDYSDTYMINELTSFGTVGAHIVNESDIGGIGTLAPGLRPLDTDNDGMPDWWEQAAGTNAAVADNNGDLDADGYTNIENYLNSLVIAGVPTARITGVLADTGASSTDGVTSDNTLVITGTTEPFATVTLARVDTGVIGTATANSSGVWSFDYTATALPDRYYALTATASLPGAVPTPAFVVKVDSTAPAAPAITSLLTSPSLTFNGTAEPSSSVTVTLDGVGPVGTATADGLGNWTAAYTGAPLAPGVYSFTAVSVDLSGNPGPASAPYIVDTSIASPVIAAISTDSGVSATDRITNDTTLTFSGTAPLNATVSLTRIGTGVIGTSTANGAGAWSFVYTTALTAGQHSFIASASTGGASSPASTPLVVMIDTSAPAVSSSTRLTPSSASTTGTTLVFRVTFAEPVVNVDTSDFALTNAGTGMTGTISSVAPVSATVYDVTVTGAGGDGTIRLDRKGSATITDIAGNTSSSTAFTTGQAYTIRLPGSGVWTNVDTVGLWSGAANWEAGAIADGVGATADFGTLDLAEDLTVQLDSPRTISRLVFADADQSSPASWTLSNNGNPANTITFPASGTPTIQVIQTGATGVSNPDISIAGAATPATIDVALNTTTGLTKTGWGTAILARTGSIAGTINVNQGQLKIGTGHTLTIPTLNIAVSSQFHVAGGNVTVTGDVNQVSGTGVALVVSGGTGSFQKILPTNGRNNLVKITGGTMTATELNFLRSADAANMFQTGLVVQGGTATIGTVGLGTANSWGAMSIEGGELNVPGLLHIGYQSTSARGGQARVLGGRLNSTEPTFGIVMSRKNGSNANNVAQLDLLGGVTTAEKITLGYDNTVTAGSATITLDGGALYLGTGGLVKNGTAGLASTVNLTSGTLGAKAAWTTSVPFTLTTANTAVIKTADEGGNAFDITHTGALLGAGGFTKTGAGTLALSGASTFTGDVGLDNGTLAITGTLAAGGTINVNLGGTLAGTGSVGKAISLNGGGSISPGIGGAGTLSAGSLTWNGGGQLAFDLGTTSDQLALTGALTKGTAGVYGFAFTPTTPPVIGTTHTLVTFGSTTFTAADFAASGLGYAKGQFVFTAGTLQFVITSDGTGMAAFTSWIAGYGLPAGQVGPGDDADGDGQSNLLEFILAQNPAGGGVENVSLITVTDGGARYPALRFIRRQARGDIGLEVRVNADLDFAATLGAVEVSVTNQGNGTDLVVVRSAVSYAVRPKQFLRLEATLP